MTGKDGSICEFGGWVVLKCMYGGLLYIHTYVQYLSRLNGMIFFMSVLYNTYMYNNNSSFGNEVFQFNVKRFNPTLSFQKMLEKVSLLYRKN